MKKLIGLKKVNTAVFISGTGSNLKNLIKFSKTKKSPISINLIISNTKKAKGLKYSIRHNIEKKIINFKNRGNAEKKIFYLMRKNNIKFICLAGFMKILSGNFIKKFNGKIINIHPSLLPKYKGLNTHEKAIKNKDKFYDYSNLMIEALNKSNIQKIRSDIIIDYLKKSSLAKED